jgi:predicted metal-dependent hydrolase
MTSLTIDDLRFEVRRSQRRKSLQITVDRSGELLLTAPEVCSTRFMEKFVREKRFWIYTKLAEKETLASAPPTKKYVSGEGFPYLGRSYRLLLVDRQDLPVRLDHGRFLMLRTEADHGREQMIRWYMERARTWLERRVARYQARVGVEPGVVVVQDLGFRWGSCGKGARLNFHWRSILLPPRIIEYVIVHELVHIQEPHHTPTFWGRVERALPDFAARKRWLAEHARRYDI